ncbi:MAG TPA: hypothetical protein DCL74_02080 [Succinivibrionaceae bacterium]|nr:hypothetical protein [Succinivibrionaceae bacterium]
MPDKVEHLGEDKFVRAYADEGVSFRNFDQKTLKEADCRNSGFALVRQMAGQKETLINQSELGQSPAIKNRNSVMELIHGGSSTKPQEKETSVPVLQSSGNLPRRRSSLKAFLTQHSVLSSEQEPIVQERAVSLSTQVSSDARGRKDDKANSQTGYAKTLFSSSHDGNYATANQDEPLQDIYKRLMKCQ